MKLLAVKNKIFEILKDDFGELLTSENGDFTISYQSAKIFISPREWDNNQPIVRVFSIINVDVPLSFDLFKFIATENFKILLGSISYDEENMAVWIEHVLLGEEVSRESLITVISAIAVMADEYSNLIFKKFGGIKYTDV